MERNNQENLFYSTNRDSSNRYKSPQSKNFVHNYAFNQSTRSTSRDLVSPTYRAESKEFTNTLRKGNKSSSKIRLRSANSISLNSNNFYDLNDNKYTSLKLNDSRDNKSTAIANTYGENGKLLFVRVNFLSSILCHFTKKIINKMHF